MKLKRSPALAPSAAGAEHDGGSLIPDPLRLTPPKLTREARRRLVLVAAMAVGAAIVGASVVGVAGIGERLTTGRPVWVAAAVGLELVSALGFVTSFQLVFAEWLPRRMSKRVGLVVFAATILVPVGGLLAIGVTARTLRKKGTQVAKAGPRAVAFLLITNAPNLLVLGVVGLALGAGLLDGPHAPVLTILPGAIALSVIVLVAILPRVSHRRAARAPTRLSHRILAFAATQLELGVIEVRALLAGRNWKLLGPLVYYAFDNAVLWATFKAFGHTVPPIPTLIMAYLIGSAAGTLPVPAGIGVVEGGMIGLLVLYGAPAVCAGIAVLAYRAITTGMPLALGGAASLTLRPAGPRDQGQRFDAAPVPARLPG